MSNLSTLPKGDSAWLLRKAIERIIDQVSVLETNIGVSTSGNSANTQIIFNDDGTLRGDAGLVYNKTTDALTVAGLVTAGSATITGDLTAGTNALKVFPATNRVLINQTTAIQGDALEVSAKSDGGTISLFGRASDNGATLTFRANGATTAKASLTANDNGLSIRTGTVERYNIDTTGVSTWSVAGTTAMTLNSTGLGIGRSPSYRFQASSGTKATTASVATVGGVTTTDTDDFGIFFRIKTDATAANRYAAISSFDNGSGNGARDLVLQDLGGNVGIGVTPSPYIAVWKALDIFSATSVIGSSTSSIFGNNVFVGAAGNTFYKINNLASYYQQQNGIHSWLLLPTGLAGETTTVSSGLRYTITSAGGTNYTTFGAADNNPGTSFTASSSGTGNGGGVRNSNVPVSAMTLDTAGRLQLGTTGGTLPSRLYLSGDATNNWSVGPYTSAPGNFYITANNTAGVFLNGTGATAWSAISDERYKDIIEPISNAVSKVGSLRAVIGKFKFDPEGTRRSFLIAQDLLAAFPEVVITDNPDKLAVTYTEIIPLLVAAIKELTARVQNLEAR